MVRTWLQVTLLVALAVFYAVTSFVALRPQVSEQYRDYYIRRATSDWRVERGARRLSDGFDLSQTVYPADVDYVRGLSAPEPWGRWSDQAMSPVVSIVLRDPLSGPLCLDVRLRVAPLRPGTTLAIRLGDESATVAPPDTEPRDYRVEMQLARPAWSIDLEPGPTRSADRGGLGDPNGPRVAIGLIRLQARPGACPS